MVRHRERTPRLTPARRDAHGSPVSAARLKKIEALVLDCDGVLTKGDLFYDENGQRTLVFNARDGAGIAMLARAGVRIAILSGRPVDIAEKRHKELGVSRFVGKCPDKNAGLVALCEELGVSTEHTAFIGDDIPDLGGFVAAGLKIAVGDADPEVIARADWITSKRGGEGAVREVCEALLKARGAWAQMLAKIDSASST